MFLVKRKCLNYFIKANIIQVIRNYSFNTKNTSQESIQQLKAPDYIEFKNDWPKDELLNFVSDMRLVHDFINEEEEQHFLLELEPYLKRMRYEFDHWDDAIHGFRETERKNWYPANKSVIQRISEVAFNGEIMPYIHVLDLADNGVIKPHVDSTRYCGTTIAGISLLTDCVMRLVRTDEMQYKQAKVGDENNDYRDQPKNRNLLDPQIFYADILLKRRSLYIMKDSARYKFTHEILDNDNSYFKSQSVKKSRRISVICRNEA